MEQWQGRHFLDYFNFHVGSDPTNGFVNYLDKSAAEQAGLVKYTDSGSIHLGVDHTTRLSTSGPGRNSVRIGTKKYYGQSLIVADIAHMPGSICGTWPAFWSVGQNWPTDGEIDIIEGVNKQDHNEIVMHTGGTCSIQDKGMSGLVNATGCGEDLGTVGCVIEGQTGSYGTSFNKQGGGVYALEWTSQYLKIWFFPRHAIPPSIKSGNPDVTKFGIPMALVQDPSCDVAKSFKAQSFVFDVTFCGDWAGGVYGQSTCPQTSSDSFQSCTNFVASHPAAFEQTYWEINSVKVYQTGVQAMLTSTSTSTSTSQVSEVTPTPTPETAATAETTSPASVSETTAGHETPSHVSESPVAVQTSATHVSQSSATQGTSTHIASATSATVETPASQGGLTEAPAATTEPNTVAQKPATTRYVTKLVTATTTMCSQQDPALDPVKHVTEASATSMPAPTQLAHSEVLAASQIVKTVETAAEQQQASHAEPSFSLAAASQPTDATNRDAINVNSSVDAVSNDHTQSATANELPTVISAPGYTLGPARVASDHSPQKSMPVIPTPTGNAPASGSAFAGASPSGNSPVFTGAAAKLSSKFPTIAFAVVFAMLA